MGYALVSAYKAAEGIPYLNAAVNLAKSCSEPECYQRYTLDRFLRNRGRAKQQLKQFEDALLDFSEAEYFQEKIHGPNSHYDGEHERSKIAAWRRNLKDAYKLSQEAHGLVSVEKPAHASTMAAEYRMGWIAMLLEDYDLSLQHLQKALVICQLNEPQRGNSGESARVRWRMSQVYDRMGNHRDARALYEDAVRTKRMLLATGDYGISSDEEASWDALVGLLYR